MSREQALPLDQGTVDFFALKGTHVGCTVPQTNNINGLKVRRVMQLIRDFSKKPLDQIRILDLACGEGVYSIEAALRGARVMGVDARTERMNEGAKVAQRLGLNNIRFEQCDVRNVAARSHGKVDVVLFLGILYHLDQRDVFPVLENIFEMCEQFLIIDTHIALQNRVQIEHEGRIYEGEHYREHDTSDSEAVRKSRLMASVDNPTSFWFTRESLYRLLHDVGFTSVCECYVPLEPFKPDNRVTLIAAKGEPVQLSSYPWVNGKTEAQIESLVADRLQASGRKAGARRAGALGRALGKLGLK